MADEDNRQQEQSAGAYFNELYFPPGLVAHFVNHFQIASTEQEAYISFFQPEVLSFGVTSSSDEQSQLKRAKCMARLVLTRPGLDAFIEMLTENRDKWRKRTT